MQALRQNLHGAGISAERNRSGADRPQPLLVARAPSHGWASIRLGRPSLWRVQGKPGGKEKGLRRFGPSP
jgi:hypothetical protein